MRQQFANLVMVSVFRPEVSEADNLSNTETTKMWLKINGIDFQIVQGMYKGNIETAFVVPMKHQRSIEAIARDYKQESILLRHGDYSCELLYLETKLIEPLGYWTEVSKNEALELNNYTLEIESGRYFTVKGQ